MKKPYSPSESLTPMSADEAKRLTDLLMTAYPALNLSNPKGYLTQLCELLMGYPLWAGSGAIRDAMDHSKFPPARAELKAVLDDQVRYVRRAAQLEQQRQVQLEPPREVRPTYAELQAKYGKTFGIGEVTETPEQVNARWAGQVQSWDEIKAHYEANPERWAALTREREDGLR